MGIEFPLTICLVALTVAHVSLAQNSPQDFLAAHNAARAQVGVRPMTWDDTVAAYAQRCANNCSSVPSERPYGQNVAQSFLSLTAAEAVKFWVDEKPHYDYAVNECTGGECLHYTQVVWRNSTRLGCASVRCYEGYLFVTCNYDPPGNYLGERPY